MHEDDIDREKMTHVPVLLGEVLDFLAPRPGGRYLDGTLGLGGHARAVLERAGGGAELVGLDRDERALALARERLAPFGAGAHLFLGRYSTFPEVLDGLGWAGVDGALVDLGVSSLQLDDPARGFSFMADGPLDMRMGDADGTSPASNLVNMSSVEHLKDIIGELGEEPMAGRIARAIDNARTKRAIETTGELAAIVERAYPPKWRRTARNHPATRTFQALRMAVNDELGELESFLKDVVDRLNPGGRVVVISFHSLEDRLVKYAFRREATGCTCPLTQPMCICGGQPRVKILTKRPVTASEAELRDNSRSRSAKLRAAQRLGQEDQA